MVNMGHDRKIANEGLVCHARYVAWVAVEARGLRGGAGITVWVNILEAAIGIKFPIKNLGRRLYKDNGAKEERGIPFSRGGEGIPRSGRIGRSWAERQRLGKGEHPAVLYEALKRYLVIGLNQNGHYS